MKVWLWGGGWYVCTQVRTKRVIAGQSGTTILVGDAPMVMREGRVGPEINTLVIG